MYQVQTEGWQEVKRCNIISSKSRERNEDAKISHLFVVIKC